MTTEPWVSVEQVAQHLGVAKDTVYLMGLNRGQGLAHDNFVLIADKKTRGSELESDIGFNLKSWQQLRFDSTRQLEEALTESIEIFYGLRGIGA